MDIKFGEPSPVVQVAIINGVEHMLSRHRIAPREQPERGPLLGERKGIQIQALLANRLHRPALLYSMPTSFPDLTPLPPQRYSPFPLSDSQASRFKGIIRYYHDRHPPIPESHEAARRAIAVLHL